MVSLGEFENRVLLAGQKLPGAALLSRRLRLRLKAIDSCIAHEMSVRTLENDP